jgi:hypothetical protein
LNPESIENRPDGEKQRGGSNQDSRQEAGRSCET